MVFSPSLVVATDDHECITRLSEFCELKGYAVSFAASFEESGLLVECEHADLVLIDMDLGEEGSLGFASSMSGCLNKPVVMLAGPEHAGKDEAVFRAGGIALVEKPFDPSVEGVLFSNLLRIHSCKTETCGHVEKPALPLQKPTYSVPGASLPDGYGRSWSLLQHGWLLLSPEGEQVRLTMKEFELVHALALPNRVVFFRKELLELFGYRNDTHGNKCLESLIYRVRRKSRSLGVELIGTAYAAGWSLTVPVVLI